MRITLLLLLFNLSATFSFAQNDFDTYFSQWKDNSKSDTFRLEALLKSCSDERVFTKPDSAIFYAQKAYDFAKKRDLKIAMARALSIQGAANTHLNNFDKGIELQEQSINIYKSTGYLNLLPNSYNKLGNVYLKKSDFINAIAYYRQSINFSEQLKDTAALASAKNNIGLIYYDLEDFEKALKFLNESVRLRKSMRYENVSANTLINIGTVYRKQKKYDKALALYNQGLILLDKSNTKYGLAICNSNIGLTHLAKGDKNKALVFLNRSMQLHKTVGNQKGIANCLIHFGNIKLDSQPDSSIIYGKQALRIAKQTSNRAEIVNASELLYKAHRAKSQYDLAFSMQDLYQSTKDSIYGPQSQKAILKIEMEYELKKKELADQIIQEQKLRKSQLHRQFERFALLFIFLIIAFAGIVFYQRQIAQNKRKRQQLLDEISLLKERLTSQSLSFTSQHKEIQLNKEKIELAINNNIGDSAWQILTLIFNNPSISNKELASAVSLSVEGVSSSLRRMYNAFDIKTSSNKKITLIMTAVRLSLED